MPKPNPLAAALKKSIGGDSQPSLEGTSQEKTIASSKTVQASRQNKKPINAYIEPAGVRELKILAADTGRTQQELIIEAINDLLIKHGRKPLA